MRRTYSLVTYRGNLYQLVTESFDVALEFLFDKTAGVMPQYRWYRLRVREDDGRVWHVRRKEVR